MNALGKFWSVILVIGALSWLYNFVEVLMGVRDFSPWTLGIAFLATFLWLIEAAVKSWTGDDRF